ncbi:MAG: hypothetical protein R2911_43690 [Caldilineaceae bacterium]
MNTLNPSCLENRLTDAERAQFDENGFFMIENALSAEQVSALTKVVDRIFEAKQAAGEAPGGRLFYGNFIPDSPLFLDLVDYRTCPGKQDILGWNISLSCPPDCDRALWRSGNDNAGWHRTAAHNHGDESAARGTSLRWPTSCRTPASPARQLLGGARQPFVEQHRQAHRRRRSARRRHTGAGQAGYGRLL